MTTKGLRFIAPMSALTLATLLALGAPPPAVAQEVHAFNIYTQDSASAIRAFGMQSGMQILASAEDLDGKSLNPVHGNVATDAALSNMLAGTGLGHRYVDDRTVALVSIADPRFLMAQVQQGTAASVPQAAASAPTNLASAVDEVLVTARRREESLQDVPIAISAFGAANLESRGVDRIENMNAVAPNLQVMGGGTQGESTANFRVRGMPGVAIYVDGVDQPTTDGLLTMGVVEIDRIEVLRGPQGTLFGNSSLGGAISYVTKLPADTFGARVKASIGSFSRRDIQAAVDVPISDTLKTKFTAASQFRDGFMHSVLIDRSYGDINDQLVRGDFLWKPVDAVSVRYSAEKADTNRNGPARVIGEVTDTAINTVGGRQFNAYPQGQIYANVGIPFNNITQTSGYPGGQLGKYETKVAWTSPGIVIDTMRHTLDANWDINDTFRVRSISGYKELTRYAAPDQDGSSEVTVNNRDPSSRQFSFGQELQVLGSHEHVNWVLGGFYQQQYNRSRNNQRILAEFTCDLWTNADIANRRITLAQQAACLNLRARAVGVSTVSATPNMTRAQIQALSAPVSATNLTGGALTAASNARGPYNGVSLSDFNGGLNSDGLTLERLETKAVFGDITWRFTDQLSVAAGLRYSQDTSDGTITVGTGSDANKARALSFNGLELTGVMPNMFGYRDLPDPTGATKFDALTKRLTVQYQWNPDLMTYIGYSDGYAPGGITFLQNLASGILTLNSAGVATAGYMKDVYNAGNMDMPLVVERDEQTVKSYEIGMRADWLGGALRTNITAFFTDWSNVPTSTYAATRWWDTNGDGFADAQIDVTGDGVNDIYSFSNQFQVAATKAEAKGVEIETNWRASENLRLNLNVGYLKTEYTELGQAGMYALPAIREGTVFAGAPEFTANVGGQYDFALANGAAIIPRIDYTYTDDFSLQANAETQRIQKGFGLLNARLSYDSGNNWSVNLAGSNLTNEYYYNGGLFSRGQQIYQVTVGRPREYGLTFDFRFD